MITCVESKNPVMETLPEFPPKKVPVLEKTTTSFGPSTLCASRTRPMSIPVSESCASSESPAYCELSRPFGLSDAGQHLGRDFCCRFLLRILCFNVDSRKGGCKATSYPSSKTLRFGCQDRPVTGNVHG